MFMAEPRGKGKGHLIACHEGTEGEKKYSSSLSLIQALDVCGWLAPHPCRFILVNGSDPLHSKYSKLVGSHSRPGRIRNGSLPPTVIVPSSP
jgi:hypothetical protein